MGKLLRSYCKQIRGVRCSDFPETVFIKKYFLVALTRSITKFIVFTFQTILFYVQKKIPVNLN